MSDDPSAGSSPNAPRPREQPDGERRTDGPGTDRGPGTRTLTQPRTAAEQLPAITLPRGGGAIRGMGEKFAVNPVTETGSLTVPISPGRSGFTPS